MAVGCAGFVGGLVSIIDPDAIGLAAGTRALWLLSHFVKVALTMFAVVIAATGILLLRGHDP